MEMAEFGQVEAAFLLHAGSHNPDSGVLGSVRPVHCHPVHVHRVVHSPGIKRRGLDR